MPILGLKAQAVISILAAPATAFHVLYPKHPLPPLRVDEEYYEEFLLVKDRGIPCSLFNLEAFEGFDPSGRFRPRPEIPTGSNVLYRGWMMHPERYEMLVSRIEENGAHPITSNSDYMRCHHLPGWYDVCKDLTAETIFLQADDNDDDIISAANKLGWENFFVKDFVKSNTLKRGSIANTARDIVEIVEQIREYRGEIEGGIALRKVEKYDLDSERRYFVVEGKCYGPDGDDVPDIVKMVAERISAPFFSVDVVQMETTGGWRLVELGDGQVSSMKDWPLDAFVDMLVDMAAKYST